MSERYIFCPEPGWYDGILMDDYHGPDLTPEYALSSSGAVEILESPLTFWSKSAMNPDWQAEEKKEFDIGSALHLLVLEREMFAGEIEILNYPDWKTIAAKDARAAARANQQIPLLPKDYELVLSMRDAIARDPTAQNILDPSNEPQFEQTFVTKDAVSGRWYRARPDVTIQKARVLVDVKTTTAPDAESFARVINDQSYHQRAAWQIDEVNGCFEKPNTFTRFIFLAVTKPKPPAPPIVNVLELDPEDIERGRELNVAAKGIFHYAMTTGLWAPLLRAGSMQPMIQSVALPPYARIRHDDIRAAGWLEKLAALRAFQPEEEK